MSSILQYSSSRYYSNVPTPTAAYGLLKRPEYPTVQGYSSGNQESLAGRAYTAPTSPRKDMSFMVTQVDKSGTVGKAATTSAAPAGQANQYVPGSWGASIVKTPRMRQGRVTLVLDLDETLVHSSFEPVACDMQIPLYMDGQHYTAYVAKRPGVDTFLAKVCEMFDVIIWTASLRLYAEPLIRQLVRSARCGPIPSLFRDSCTLHNGGYVKDLTSLGIHLDDVCILDNSPSVALFQPQNLIPIESWYDDMKDTALLNLVPHLERLARSKRSTREFIQTIV